MINQEQRSATMSSASESSVRLGTWSFYFLVKFLLFWRELIGFHPLENMAFAAFLLAPVYAPRWRHVRTLAATPVGLALFYYDSWLPPAERIWSQASQLSSFSPAYLAELLGRFINWQVVAMLVISWGIYRLVNRYLRVGVAVIIALIVMTISMSGNDNSNAAAATDATASTKKSSADASNLDSMLQEFYANEAQRSINLPKADGGTPFDIVFVHICSLSWDDLQAAGLDKHPLWNNFDFLFRHFNSAASYSGPAAIRINRALCGQTPHKALYSPAPDNCYLFPNLARAGFETNLAFNHDGHFDDFLAGVRQQGVSAPLMPVNGVAAPMHGFDGSPIYDDLGVLNRWLDTRKKANAERAALFYNTISLHDGNVLAGAPGSRLNTHDTYKPRAEKLLNDLNTFMDEIRKSGRRAIVVVVPEHGAALRGDKFQIAGLREIPTPSITTVPVGVKVVGNDAVRNGAQAQISEPISYLGLSQLVAHLIEHSPYGEAGFNTADYAHDLPATDHVAENDGAAIIARGNRYFLKQGNEGWKEYMPSMQ